jgi:hypothetical protein
MLIKTQASIFALVLGASLSVACSDGTTLGGHSSKSKPSSQSLTGEGADAKNESDANVAAAGAAGDDGGDGGSDSGSPNDVDSELANRDGAGGKSDTDSGSNLACQIEDAQQLDAAKGLKAGWGSSGSVTGAATAANAQCKNFDRADNKTYVVCQIDGTTVANCTPYAPGKLSPALEDATATEFAQELSVINAANHAQCLQLVAAINKKATQDPVGCFRVQDVKEDGADK